MANLKCALCDRVVYCKDCERAKVPFKKWARKKNICDDCYKRIKASQAKPEIEEHEVGINAQDAD